MHRLVSHPDQIASYLRQRTTWRDLQPRGGCDHAALDWEDACLALAGCSGLAFQAFSFRHSEEPPGRELVAYLLEVARRELGDRDQVTAEQLVELLLREERAPVVQRTERHRILALGVAAAFYARHVARPYASVAAAFEILASDAWRACRGRLDAA